MLSLLNYITWNVSPFIYEGEHFAIGWYGTLWVLGLIGMLVTLLVTFKHDGVPTQLAYITFMVTLVCVIFGGHIFQGLFYEWYYTPDNPAHFLGIDWVYRNHYFEHPWKFLDIAHGGFASHGCIVGGILAAWLLYKPFKCSSWWLSDRIMIGIMWVALGVRLGNFFNAEIYGVPTDLPWGVVFHEGELPCHPTQFYEFAYYLIFVCIGLWILKMENLKKYNGLVTSLFLLTGLMRIVIECCKNPQMEIEQGWVLNMGQWLSIPFVVCGIVLLKKVLSGNFAESGKPDLSISRTERRRQKRKK